MVLPNAHHAVVKPGEVRDDLLFATHLIGRFKAVVLLSMRYEADHWQVLRLRHMFNNSRVAQLSLIVRIFQGRWKRSAVTSVIAL